MPADDGIDYFPPVAIESPCVLVCTLDLTTGWCFGCGRTADEIAQWTALTPEGRDAVLAALPERCALLERQIAAATR
ncbi:DUF1289 domain-containing protein [Sphingomonas sp. ac-8]|uniref:DUF1289 domain-containing protein n=1 Tax=Sphingomonas sp. ac-8 TaxID=3242977 RepID=UPI003A8093DB